MEEVSAADGCSSGKIDVVTGAASEATAGSMNKTVSEEGNNKKMKKTKTMRVQQEFIDGLLKVYPFRPFPGEPEELEKNIEDAEARERLRAMLAPVTAFIKEVRDKEEAIIKQYLAQGYAEEEVEVTDDDDDEA